jgi:hypothetical protein
MGSIVCCKSKSKILPTVKIQSTDGQRTHCDLDLIYQDFKTFILTRGLSMLPLDSNSLQKLFDTQIKVSKQNILQDYKDKSRFSSSFNNNLQFFEAKCRALEGYIRYLNDYKSLILLRDLKIKYVEQISNGFSDREQVLGLYYKEIRGSYILQGYSELNDLIAAQDFEEMNEIIMQQYREAAIKLKKRYEDIEKFQVIDDEVYLKTLGSDIHLK